MPAFCMQIMHVLYACYIRACKQRTVAVKRVQATCNAEDEQKQLDIFYSHETACHLIPNSQRLRSSIWPAKTGKARSQNKALSVCHGSSTHAHVSLFTISRVLLIVGSHFISGSHATFYSHIGSYKEAKTQLSSHPATRPCFATFRGKTIRLTTRAHTHTHTHMHMLSREVS